MDFKYYMLLIAVGLSFVYGIFMIMYLNDAEKCDQHLSNRDKNFRKVALVISWIDVILTGYALLVLILQGLSSLDKQRGRESVSASLPSTRLSPPSTTLSEESLSSE